MELKNREPVNGLFFSYEMRNFDSVKRVFSIFFITQILTGNVFAGELLKIPRLFSHFSYHQNELKDISEFGDFIQKHYSDDSSVSHSSHHEKDDCQLPFKHCGHNCLVNHSLNQGVVPSGVLTQKVFSCIQKIHFNQNQDNIESCNLNAIWQPPKRF